MLVYRKTRSISFYHSSTQMAWILTVLVRQSSLHRRYRHSSHHLLFVPIVKTEGYEHHHSSIKLGMDSTSDQQYLLSTIENRSPRPDGTPFMCVGKGGPLESSDPRSDPQDKEKRGCSSVHLVHCAFGRLCRNRTSFSLIVFALLRMRQTLQGAEAGAGRKFPLFFWEKLSYMLRRFCLPVSSAPQPPQPLRLRSSIPPSIS
jgi:hypothetical protein